VHVVSKKRWQIETGRVDFTETVIQCADFSAVLAALTGYRLQNGTPPVEPRILFGLFDPKVQACPVALWATDGLADNRLQ
jgi:hypothetical protein